MHNRVADIESVARRIREAVPEARIAVAHGQMAEDRLEKIIDGFWAREWDVLLCTTIVETGLDISNANTLIVDHAEVLGLSQMHQLRGRVGRGRERGYAYFLYPGEKPLTETAHDRLATIAQNSDLGAGMAVAMKDLEIRGAGSILGAEQSGHIAGVGFDLYIRLVGEAVNAFKKAASSADGADAVDEEPAEVRVELPIDANIPHSYIPVERLRLDAYRRIAGATSPADVDAVRDELVDRYGPLGEQVENLLAVASFRQLCRSLGVTEVAMGPQGLRMSPIHLPESGQTAAGPAVPGFEVPGADLHADAPAADRGRPDGRYRAPRSGRCCDYCAACSRTWYLRPRWSASRENRLSSHGQKCSIPENFRQLICERFCQVGRQVRRTGGVLGAFFAVRIRPECLEASFVGRMKPMGMSIFVSAGAAGESCAVGRRDRR